MHEQIEVTFLSYDEVRRFRRFLNWCEAKQARALIFDRERALAQAVAGRDRVPRKAGAL